MTKVEFLTVLESELKKRRIGEREEILAEYEQHFAFQRADGFSQEEICARLGDPAQLAAQFDAEGRAPAGGGKTAARAGIYALSVLALALYLVLAACGVAMLALCAASAALAVCLLGGLSAGALTPPMSYGCAAVFGVALAALSVLVAVGCVYFAALLWRLPRAYGRFCRNAIAAAGGEPMLPTDPATPRFAPGRARRMRTVALVAFGTSVGFSLLGMAVAMLCAGALPFWHAWGWFGYTAGV